MSASPNLHEEVLALRRQVEDALELLRRLLDENRSLRASQESLTAERANLMAKNEQARSRVEAMITRLKALEQNG